MSVLLSSPEISMVCVLSSDGVKRTEFQCPLCGKVGAVEVFQPRLLIFRAEPSIDASIGTFVPSKCELFND